MIHKSPDRYFVVPEGSVQTAGGSLNIAKDQIGLFAIDKKGQDGIQAITSVAGLDKSVAKFEIRLGTNGILSRTNSDKAKSSIPFKLTDVKKAWVGRPSVTEQTFDELYIGYNGFDPETTLAFKAGDYFMIQLNLWGKVLGMANPTKAKVYTVEHLINLQDLAQWDVCNTEDPCEPIDCRQQTLETVKYFNEYMLPNGVPLKQFLEINPVFSCTPPIDVETTDYTLYELSFCGFEDGSELGKVQAQYPDYKVTRNPMTNTFQVLIPEADGAPDDYVQTLGDIIPNCEGCPADYDLVAGGLLYVVKLEDDGANSAPVVQALPGAVASTAVKRGQNYGVGYYTVIINNALTQAEINTFIGTNPTASVFLAGEKGAICVNTDEVDVPWTEVETATASVKQFEIIIADDCNGSRLAELQAKYPELTITASTTPTPANCIRKYLTEVTTDIVFPTGCEGADFIQAQYTAEAPEAFDVNTYWTEVIDDAATACLCGIHVKGKPVVMNADGECLIDELPFIATSMRVKAAGGFILDNYLNTATWNNPIAITQVSRATDMDNLGGNMRSFERQGNYYFLNESYYKDVYTRSLLGTENTLGGLRQYNFFSFQVDSYKQAQSMGGYALDTINYHMIAPVDESTAVENLLTTIAAGAGVPVLQQA